MSVRVKQGKYKTTLFVGFDVVGFDASSPQQLTAKTQNLGAKSRWSDAGLFYILCDFRNKNYLL